MPLLTTAHWYTNSWLKKSQAVFSLPFFLCERYASMLMTLTSFSLMRIQIKWEATWRLLAPAFDSSVSIYPSKHWKPPSVMSSSSLPSIKTPAVTASMCRVVLSLPSFLVYTWVMYDITVTRISVSAESGPDAAAARPSLPVSVWH